ncbi:MAG: two-component regulator propeller domain-containing protein, partial [Holophaga sp.]|nr:two-component regulator propeller domain-containing protein [Holophaga sp.]
MAWKRVFWGLALWLLGSVAQAEDLPKARTAFKIYGVESGMDNLAVWSIIQDHQGFMWMATEGGVSRYDGHRFQNFGMDQGLPSGEVFVMHQDPAGNLWAGTYQGLGRWSEGRFVCPEFPRVPVESLATGPEGRIWVSTPQGPFQQEANGTFQKVPGWPGGEATALWAAPGLPKVWVASSRSVGGKFETEVFEFETGKWRNIPCVPGFQSIRLDALAGDVNGRLWARSATQLWVLKPTETTFRLAQTPPMVAGSRGYLSIDRKGQLWISTNSSLLTMVGDTWQVMGKEQGFPADFARSIAEDREGNLWVAGVGAYRRLGRGVLTTYGTTEGLPSNIIRTIFRDRTHQLWIGTDRGACRAKGGVWETIPGTANLVARCLVEDAQGRLYMAGNTQEILRYDPKTRSLKRFPIDIGRPTKRIFKLLIDSADRLWAATEAAGVISTTCTGSRLDFKPVELPGGDASERVSDMFQEPGGRIWACGANGLALLEQGKWQRFGARDGLRENHVSYARLTPSGDLLVSYFNPL